MKTCRVYFKSASAYSQSRAHVTPKLEKEAADDYEKRTWRERVHADSAGVVFIPGMSLKMTLDNAAKFLSEKIPGKRNATYTKHFLAGVLVLEDMPIGIKKADVEAEWLFMNADGVRGSGKRVWRCYPLIREWEGEATFYVADDTVTKEVFEHHMVEAGKFVGLGRFAPRAGGTKGRFSVEGFEWR